MTRAGADDQAHLVAISRDALLLTDAAGKIRFANPAASELLNTPAGALRSRLLVAHVEPAQRRSFRAALERAARGEAFVLETELMPRRLPPLAVRAHVAPVGEQIGWVLRAEAPAQQRHEAVATPESTRLGRILEAVRDGVLVLDRDRCVLFANRAAAAMFAPLEIEIGGSVPEPWSISVRRLVDELFLHDAFNAEAIVEPEGGTAYWLRAYQSGADGTSVLLVSDITDEERRERAERDFVAHAAHELQSPLTGISGAVEVLLAGAHEEEAPRLRFLRHIARENERLTRLLRSLLVLAEAQATEHDVETEPFELRPLLEEIAAEAPDATAVDVEFPADLAVVAHRDLVAHAVGNLVANGIRHGGGRVVLAARRGRAGRVEVTVTDSGPGIPTDVLARVFERFYRGDRAGEGFGLGLPIVRQVARAVGGDVELRPNPGGGTIAVLTLRAAT